MNVSFELPQDAIPDKNPHMSVELQGIPRVGDLVGCHGVDDQLVVRSVSWEIAPTSTFKDVGSGPYIELGWHYVDE